MHRLILALIAVLAAWSLPARAQCEEGAGRPATGQQGVALLIGVSDYEGAETGGWARLPNAVRDIDLVCGSLADAGYRLIVVRDPTWAELDEAVVEFHLAALESSAAIVYFAGHGFEYDGTQFLVPADAPTASTPADMRGHFIPMDRLLDAAGSASDFALLMLDACRTALPQVHIDTAADASGRPPPANIGLFTVPKGAVIYSTISGRPALDEAPVGSDFSPFANAVAAGMAIPGLELGDFFAWLHEDIAARTAEVYPGGPQYPALYKVTPARFYIVDPDLAVQPAEAVPDAIALPSLDRIALVDEPVLLREVLAQGSVAELESSAASGDGTAQYLLGYAYNFGIGVLEDDAVALEWMEQSAAQDHPGGLTELAYFLQQQVQDEPDAATAARAMELFESAAAQGYAKAQSHLAYALWTGNLGTEDRDRALGLFAEASEQGHVYATAALAFYAPGERENAEARLRDLARAGNAEGSNWLCELHYSSGSLMQDSPDRARQVADCETAALNNYAGARVIYAAIQANGWGVEPSASEAAYWARLALAQPELQTRSDLVALATTLTE